VEETREDQEIESKTSFKTSEDLNMLETPNRSIQWRICICIVPLLGKNLKTNNETKAVVTQRHGKHASTTIELLLETVLSTRSVQRGYKENN
jgi:hypothetical protein